MAEWITTESISAEAWRRILEFANVNIAFDAITRAHGTTSNKSILKDYDKQAEQVRVSILQSKEYFEAASTTGLFTSPNHLYYGMVSLATAIMLVWGSGKQSLDYLRQDRRNTTHGLHFSTSVNKETCQKGMSMLGLSRIEVAMNGFFLNWYKILPSGVYNYAETNTIRDGLSLTSRKPFGFEKTIPSSKIVGKKDTALSLMSRLPDMLGSLVRYGHDISFSRTYLKVIDDYDKCVTEWTIHGASSPSSLLAILDKFRVQYSCRYDWTYSIHDEQRACIIKWTRPQKMRLDYRFIYPSIREDSNSKQYIFAEDLDTHEIVDGYRIAYGLSMLSRYYPDYWIRCLDSHCMAAKAIEQFVFVMLRRFPVLSLRHLTRQDVTISNQLPPWYF